MLQACPLSSFFFFNDTATTEIYTLSLHDALPILSLGKTVGWPTSDHSGPDSPELGRPTPGRCPNPKTPEQELEPRSEEHTSELQSHLNLVCRLLLEKKKHTSLLKA